MHAACHLGGSGSPNSHAKYKNVRAPKHGMKLPAILLLAAALALALAGAAHAKYTENLTVQVFDYSLRPVEGAQAYVEYELNSVKGDIKTKPKPTDRNGNANILFSNYEEIPESTDYSFTLFVKYGDQLASASLIAGEGSNLSFSSRIYTVQVESHIAFVRVIDQKGSPLDANVTVGGATKQTGAAGSTFFALAPGNYTLRVERGDLLKNIPMDMGNSTGDITIDAVLSYYSLDVLVQDDRRNPLFAQVEVNGVAAQTGSDGRAHFGNITLDSPQVVVMHGQVIKRITPDLRASPSLDVVFDLNKPAIKDQYSTLSSSGVGTIRFFVEDTGPEASGIDSVSVSYEVAGVQNPLSVYAIGYNSFETKIPAQAPGTLVKYIITISDKEGNSVSDAGSYLVPEEGAQQQNASSPPAAQGGQPISGEGVFVGIVALAIIAYAALYYLNKRRAAVQPPIAPPQGPPAMPPQIPQ